MAVTQRDYEELYERTGYAQIPKLWFEKNGRIKKEPNGTWGRRLDFVLSWHKHMKPSGSLYDWGCGANIPKKILGAYHGISVVGVDFAAGAKPDLVMDITNPPKDFRPDGEAFLSFDMMEHLYRKTLLTAHANLKAMFPVGGVMTIAYKPERRQYGQREQLHVTIEKPEWWGPFLAELWPYVVHVRRKIWAVSTDAALMSWKPRDVLRKRWEVEEVMSRWALGKRK